MTTAGREYRSGISQGGQGGQGGKGGKGGKGCKGGGLFRERVCE